MIVQGIERFKVDEWLENEPYLTAKISVVPDIVEEGQEREIEALRRRILELSNRV